MKIRWTLYCKKSLPFKRQLVEAVKRELFLTDFGPDQKVMSAELEENGRSICVKSEVEINRLEHNAFFCVQDIVKKLDETEDGFREAKLRSKLQIDDGEAYEFIYEDEHFARNMMLGMTLTSLAYLACFMLLSPFFSASHDLFYNMYTACFFGSGGLFILFYLYVKYIDKSWE